MEKDRRRLGGVDVAQELLPFHSCAFHCIGDREGDAPQIWQAEANDSTFCKTLSAAHHHKPHRGTIFLMLVGDECGRCGQHKRVSLSTSEILLFTSSYGTASHAAGSTGIDHATAVSRSRTR